MWKFRQFANLGSIKDTTQYIDKKWDYTITLEEITKAEFMNIAHKMCDNIIERRVNKFEENKDKTNAKFNIKED